MKVKTKKKPKLQLGFKVTPDIQNVLDYIREEYLTLSENEYEQRFISDILNALEKGDILSFIKSIDGPVAHQVHSYLINSLVGFIIVSLLGNKEFKDALFQGIKELIEGNINTPPTFTELKSILKATNKEIIQGKLKDILPKLIETYEKNNTKIQAQNKLSEKIESEKQELIKIIEESSSYENYFEIQIYPFTENPPERIEAIESLIASYFIYKETAQTKNNPKVNPNINIFTFSKGELKAIVLVKHYLPINVLKFGFISELIFKTMLPQIRDKTEKQSINLITSKRGKHNTRVPTAVARHIGKPPGDNRTILEEGKEYKVVTWYGTTIYIPETNIRNFTGKDIKVLLMIMDYFVNYMNNCQKKISSEARILDIVCGEEGIKIPTVPLLENLGINPDDKKNRKSLIKSAEKWSWTKVGGEFSIENGKKIIKTTSLIDFAVFNIPLDYSFIPNVSIPPFLAKAILNKKTISFNKEILRSIPDSLVIPYINLKQQFLGKRKTIKLSLEAICKLFNISAKQKAKRKEKARDYLFEMEHYQLVEKIYIEKISTGRNKELEYFFHITRGKKL
jgi:hypothetical protein